MMDINVNSPGEVRAAGMQVLAAALGPVGFTRFLQQFENGRGNYTLEKYEQPALTLDTMDEMLRVYSQAIKDDK